MQKIWTFKFLEVVWQHILRMVGNVIIILFCHKFNRLSSDKNILKIGYDLTKLSSK